MDHSSATALSLYTKFALYAGIRMELGIAELGGSAEGVIHLVQRAVKWIQPPGDGRRT